jgi:mannosylglucosylglycerate synthase
VVPRKGIELAIDLLHGLGDRRDALVITHEAGDEGLDYLRGLERRAAAWTSTCATSPIGSARRGPHAGRQALRPRDAYPHADLVTYPSLYEGFGNALLEAVAARRPVLVNRYPVYARDLARRLPLRRDRRRRDRRGRGRGRRPARRPRARRPRRRPQPRRRPRHFGLDTLDRVLDAALADLGVTP